MNKIPKVIHYCWFGRGKKPDLAKKCIESWEKFLPDYEIIEWNEDNFDINSNRYVREAYEAKKYAFVSDYVRLYALYNYGGIYMDTDVEVLKSLDKFLIHDAFSGFESHEHIAAGILGSKKTHNLIKEFLDSYDNRCFIKADGALDQTTNVQMITDILYKYGLCLNNNYQKIQEIALYPKTYFYPISFNNKETDFSDKTVAIHHYAASWITEEDRKKAKSYKKYLKRKDFLCKYISERNAYIILDFKWILRNKIKSILG